MRRRPERSTLCVRSNYLRKWISMSKNLSTPFYLDSFWISCIIMRERESETVTIINWHLRNKCQDHYPQNGTRTSTSPWLVSSDINEKENTLKSQYVLAISSSVDTGCDVFSICSSSHEPTHLHLHTSHIQLITEAKCIQGRGMYMFFFKTAGLNWNLLMLYLDEPISNLYRPLRQGLLGGCVRLSSPLLDLVEVGDGWD